MGHGNEADLQHIRQKLEASALGILAFPANAAAAASLVREAAAAEASNEARATSRSPSVTSATSCASESSQGHQDGDLGTPRIVMKRQKSPAGNVKPEQLSPLNYPRRY